ncbi:hypothetical protein SynRS9915_01033 [Synechococcus sp. RS9915]|nr:hypothetical protein SynRS9915_01033 [Synechococcus sp. RS9915]
MWTNKINQDERIYKKLKEAIEENFRRYGVLLEGLYNRLDRIEQISKVKYFEQLNTNNEEA